MKSSDMKNQLLKNEEQEKSQILEKQNEKLKEILASVLRNKGSKKFLNKKKEYRSHGDALDIFDFGLETYTLIKEDPFFIQKL